MNNKYYLEKMERMIAQLKAMVLVLAVVVITLCCVLPVKSDESISEFNRNNDNKIIKENDDIIIYNVTEKEHYIPFGDDLTTYDPIDLYDIAYTDEDIIDMAKLLYIECGGVESKTKQACVAWTVLNRVDMYDESIHDIITAPNQYDFRNESPVLKELYDLSKDVLNRWALEKFTDEYYNVGRVLPRQFDSFYGDGFENYFYCSYDTYGYWDFSLPSPYND